jgi:hypothetical protein
MKLPPEKISVSGSRCCRTSRDSELDGSMCWGFPPFVPWMLGTGMNARKLGTICALLAATPNLIGCESPRDSPEQSIPETGQASAGMSPVAGQARRRSAPHA